MVLSWDAAVLGSGVAPGLVLDEGPGGLRPDLAAVVAEVAAYGPSTLVDASGAFAGGAEEGFKFRFSGRGGLWW